MRPLRVYTAEGIVLKRTVTGEADRILTIFTKQYGKMRILAKGIRRITSRRAGHMEVFTYGVFTIHGGRTFDMVSEASTIRSGSLFDSDAIRLEYAYSFCELVDQLLADHQEHMDIFYLLRDSLNTLLTINTLEAYQALFGNFVHTILWNLGFLPQSQKIPVTNMKMHIERIIERRLRAWPPSLSE
jgi:DNA repair protein RecO